MIGSEIDPFVFPDSEADSRGSIMTFKSIKLQILVMSILLFTASDVCSQVEELPEDRVSVSGGINASVESDACKARAAAIAAVPPADVRPNDESSYERIIEVNQRIAGNTQYDEKTYKILAEAVVKTRSERHQRIPPLERKIDELRQDLLDAKNQFTNQNLIQEVQSKLQSATSELESIKARTAQEDLFVRMNAALHVLDAQRSLALLAQWSQFETISLRASKAAEAAEKELDSVKNEFDNEKARFTKEFNALKQQSDRSEETLQKARDLKLESVKNFTNLKNRLQKFICWPEVQQFDLELENVIARLRKSTTSLVFGSDFEVEDLPEDGNPLGNEEQKPPATGSRWILESTTPTPATAPQGWTYSSGSASLKIYNGDQCSFSWTPPPQQIDSNGFNVSMNVRCTAGTPGANIAGSIAASGEGVKYSDDREAYGSGTGSAGATKSVSFKPVEGSSEIEVHISIHWAIDFTYKYRREN